MCKIISITTTLFALALLPTYGYSAISESSYLEFSKDHENREDQKVVGGIIHTRNDKSQCGLKVSDSEGLSLVPSSFYVASFNETSSRMDEIDNILALYSECGPNDIAMMGETADLAVEDPMQLAMLPPVVAGVVTAAKWISVAIGAGCAIGATGGGVAGVAVKAGVKEEFGIAAGIVAGGVIVAIGETTTAAASPVGATAAVAMGAAVGGVLSMIACAKGTYYLLTTPALTTP